MSRGHARLAPSGASTWSVCTAQPDLVDELADRLPPEDETFSGPGTLAHEIATELFYELIDRAPDGFELVEEYVGFCQLVTKNNLKVEYKVPLYYSPEETGTADFVTWDSQGLYFVDLKWGEGVRVRARGNKQVAIYAMSLIQSLEIEPDDEYLVTIAIYQPRHRETYAGPVDCWAITYGDLKEFLAVEIDPAIQAIESGVTEFAPSDGVCQFCRAKTLCRARQEWLSIPSQKQIDGPGLSDEELIEFWSRRTQIRSALDAAEKYLRDTLPEGVKLVEGNAQNRSWKDQEVADKWLARYLGADRYKKTLLSPAQAEKAIDFKVESKRVQNNFAGLYERKPGKPVLALSDDPRKDITEQMFTNEEKQ